MIRTTLNEIRQALNVPDEAALADAPVAGVNTNSKEVTPGQLFVALAGERFDGHDFLEQAFAAGAAGAIVRRDRALPPALLGKIGPRLIRVADTIEALGALGRWHRTRLAGRVLAVTGSNGKTTTKRMLQHILAKSLRGSCSPKSFNNNIGVPLALLAADVTDDYVICEVGTNAPGEIAQLGAICRLDVAVITSVGETHLEKLGSLALVAAEKASLLEHTRRLGRAILWADSPELRAAAEPVLDSRDLPVTWFGASEAADLRLTSFVGRPDGSAFTINGSVEVRLPLPGRHNAMNAMAAIAAAWCMEIDLAIAAAALADFGGVAMRLEAMQLGPVRLINDAYNANPSSMVAAADVLGDQGGRRRVLVAGDMRELGPASVELHERTGRQVAQRAVDLLIGIGSLGRYIAQGAASAGVATECFESVEAAQSHLPALLREGDVVLLKGSRAMAMERLVEPIRRAFGQVGV